MTRMRRNIGGALLFLPRAGLLDGNSVGHSTCLSSSGRRAIGVLCSSSSAGNMAVCRSDGLRSVQGIRGFMSPVSSTTTATSILTSRPRTMTFSVTCSRRMATFLSSSSAPSIFAEEFPEGSRARRTRATTKFLCGQLEVNRQLKHRHPSSMWLSFARSCSGGGGVGGGDASAKADAVQGQSTQEGDQKEKDEDHKEPGVEVVYFRGLPQFTIPLPSRRESCRFIVKPLSNTVGDLLTMIREEDRGVDRVALLSLQDGVRIGASNTIEMLMEYDFKLVINDKVYLVTTPPQEKPSPEEIERLSSVRNLVGQLYAALNVDEHQLRVERELLEALEKLQLEVEPLEKKRQVLAEQASKRTNALTWVGLGLMSVQFGILARLTWWEYSWDIMEPVTYFVTYGTAMLAYAYFVLTKQEYVLPDVKDRQYLIEFHKNAKKVGLDVGKYNELKDEISRIETDLRRLRDPLALHLPLKTRLPKDFDLSKLKDSSYYSLFHKMHMMLKK